MREDRKDNIRGEERREGQRSQNTTAISSIMISNPELKCSEHLKKRWI